MHRNVETEENKEILGLQRMTKKKILELCKKDKLYTTPNLNDVLYLHYQGFQSIENLEDYTQLKCLWLESNAISEIQNLHCQTKLKCLFLHCNLIRKIENLDKCVELDTLNLSSNHIRHIENCDSDTLPVLTSLNLSSNYLTDYDTLRHLENCKAISVLDLSNNRIDDVLVVKIFSKMPSLRVLVLQGNPVVSKIAQYRKTLILECNELTYLDCRPISDRDRACAQAWKRGGYAEEREEHNRWNLKDRRKMLDSVNATIRLKNKFRKPEDQISLCSSAESEKLENPTENSASTDREPALDLQDDMWDEVKNNNLPDRSSDSEKEDEGMNSAVIEAEEDNASSSSQSTEESTVSSPVLSLMDSDEDDYSRPEITENIFDKMDLELKNHSDPDADKIDDNPAGSIDHFAVNNSFGGSLKDMEEDTTDFDMLDKLFDESKRTTREYMNVRFKRFEQIKEIKPVVDSPPQTEQEQELAQALSKLSIEVSESIRKLREANHSSVSGNIRDSDNGECEEVVEFDKHEDMSKHTKIYASQDPMKEFDISEKESLQIEAKEENSSSSAEDHEFLKYKKRKEKYTLKKNDCSDHLYCSCFDESDSESASSCSELNQLIKDLQKREAEFRELLQKLEQENDKLVQINAVESFLVEDYEKYENTNTLCESIINEVILNLELDANAVKNYKILEALQTESGTDKNKTDAMLENSEKTVSEVVRNFKIMMQENIERNRKLERLEPRKADSLKNLLESPQLAAYNGDTCENLTKQLEYMQAKRDRQVRRLVDRVYAQRDKYNDSLDVVDNKLVVVKKDTGEIEDVSPPKADYNIFSDSENEDDEYFQSSDYYNIFPTEERTLGKGDFFADKKWGLPEANANFSDSDSESSDFQSLTDETADVSNIDQDLLSKLDMLNITAEQGAGGDADTIVQCTRSYEELKAMIHESKEQTDLTMQETLLFEKILEREHSKLPSGSEDAAGKSEENIFLKKFLERKASTEILEVDNKNIKECKILQASNLSKTPLGQQEIDEVITELNNCLPIKNNLDLERKSEAKIEIHNLNFIENMDLIKREELDLFKQVADDAIDYDFEPAQDTKTKDDDAGNPETELFSNAKHQAYFYETSQEYQSVENNYLVLQSAKIFEYYGTAGALSSTKDDSSDTGQFTSTVDAEAFEDEFYLKTYSSNNPKDVENSPFNTKENSLQTADELQILNGD